MPLQTRQFSNTQVGGKCTRQGYLSNNNSKRSTWKTKYNYYYYFLTNSHITFRLGLLSGVTTNAIQLSHELCKLTIYTKTCLEQTKHSARVFALQWIGTYSVRSLKGHYRRQRRQYKIPKKKLKVLCPTDFLPLLRIMLKTLKFVQNCTTNNCLKKFLSYIFVNKQTNLSYHTAAPQFPTVVLVCHWASQLCPLKTSPNQHLNLVALALSSRERSWERCIC